jgi:hypothetical protein
MRSLAAIICIFFGSSVFADASVDDLVFMKGRWAGELGPATLEETWNDPKADTMVALVRLSTPEGLGFAELIIISEEDETLVLRLQQFSQTFEPLLPETLKMTLTDLTSNSVSFAAEEGAAITQLTYTRVSETEFTITGQGAQGPILAPLKAVP